MNLKRPKKTGKLVGLLPCLWLKAHESEMPHYLPEPQLRLFSELR